MAAEAGLCVDGVAVRDEFLPAARIRALARCAELRRGRGEFSPARIGGGRSVQHRGEIRGDSICWIASPLMAAERALLQELERLRLRLNADACLGLFDLELHHAWYPSGAGYARHVDQPQGRSQRRVSLALYLNEHWMPGAGGEFKHLRGFDARSSTMCPERNPVRMGCRPMISAATPAGMPRLRAMKTPPRYPAWIRAPATIT